MGFSQPPVRPLPGDLDFSGRAVLVTGANSGLGLEFSRQYLLRRASTVILGVRNVVKGEAVKSALLADDDIRKANPNATILVMEINLASFSSVQQFVAKVQEQVSDLHIVMINAGIATPKRGVTADGHEKSVQVNYLSNVLLFFGLLPLLEKTAARGGQPSRVTFTGSRMSASNSILNDDFGRSSSRHVIAFLDSSEGFNPMTRYGDTKLLVGLFLRELAKRYSPSRVIANQFCPGMVQTALNDDLPWYFRLPVRLLTAARARKVEVGGWVGLNAAGVVGSESHGEMLADMDLMEPSKEMTSGNGVAIQEKVWQETIGEMRLLTKIPEWC